MKFMLLQSLSLLVVVAGLQVQRTDQSWDEGFRPEWPGIGFGIFGGQLTQGKAAAAAAVAVGSAVPAVRDLHRRGWQRHEPTLQEREAAEDRRDTNLLLTASSAEVKEALAKRRFWKRLHRKHEARASHQAHSRLIVDVSSNPHSLELNNNTVVTFITCVLGGLGLIAFMMHFKIFVNY
mmetsp:Transcript_2415/g.5153  ORF Transcript_2415/g.5153 Transcript_2415/m.5153 type:complete len:179 (+) Transcript_2415:132-668(+)